MKFLIDWFKEMEGEWLKQPYPGLTAQMLFKMWPFLLFLLGLIFMWVAIEGLRNED